MEFLLDFLRYLLISILTPRFASNRNRLPYYILGLLCLAVSAASLFLYWIVYVPVTQEDYYRTTIVYTKCYSINPKEHRAIILETSDKKYRLYHGLWRQAYADEYVLNALSRSSRATVWLAGKDKDDIKGIATEHFNIEPSVGVDWDTSNRAALLWLAFFFSGLGAIVIVSAIMWVGESGGSQLQNKT